MPSRKKVEQWRALDITIYPNEDSGPGEHVTRDMADMLERAWTALRMVPPGMWHEVDEWLAEWRGDENGET